MWSNWSCAWLALSAIKVLVIIHISMIISPSQTHVCIDPLILILHVVTPLFRSSFNLTFSQYSFLHLQDAIMGPGSPLHFSKSQGPYHAWALPAHGSHPLPIAAFLSLHCLGSISSSHPLHPLTFALALPSTWDPLFRQACDFLPSFRFLLTVILLKGPALVILDDIISPALSQTPLASPAPRM